MNPKVPPLGVLAVLGLLAATACNSTPGAGGNDAQPDAGSRFAIQVELASDVDPRAPTTVGIVTWSFAGGDVESARIEFGLDTSYGMTAPVDLEKPGFRTLLRGMKPEQRYHFRVVAETPSGVHESDDQVLTTGARFDRIVANFRVLNEAARARGFILTSFWQGPNAAVPFIIDADGEVVWWYESSSEGIARAILSADAENVWLAVASNSGGPLERVTLDTLESELYPKTTASHDITPVEGATMAYLDYGEPDCNSIFEIEPSGETTEVFDTESVIPGGRLALDGCHSNALRYSRRENLYTVSDLYTDVFAVHRRGELAWRLSELVPGGNGAWGGRQHGHHLLEDSIVIFANGVSSDPALALEYTLTGSESFRYDGGASSTNLGDVQRLPGGNTLVSYSNDSLIHEVDADGNLLVEIDGGGYAFGYAEWRATLYGSSVGGED